jgi:eukaryotic-like serine/threonine-protein kinase
MAQQRSREGQQFGNYRLERLLGQGGFAEVYLGQHVRLKRLAAIKVLHAYLSEKEIDDFQREAQIIASLDHPNIVRILDFDVQNGTPFLVMDYLPSRTYAFTNTPHLPWAFFCGVGNSVVARWHTLRFGVL